MLQQLKRFLFYIIRAVFKQEQYGDVSRVQGEGGALMEPKKNYQIYFQIFDNYLTPSPQKLIKLDSFGAFLLESNESGSKKCYSRLRSEILIV